MRLNPVRILCGLVLFNPDLTHCCVSIDLLFREGFDVAVFDNSENAGSRAMNRRILMRRFPGLRWGGGEGNVGLSRAYNAFVKIALDNAFDAIILFDQDSSIPASSLRQLVSRYTMLHELPLGVLSGLALRDGVTPYRTRKVYDDRVALLGLFAVRFTPSSFSLIPASALRKVGGFYDDFFIDHIDVDFCCRCSKAGLIVAMDPLASFPHIIGEGYLKLLSRGIGPISSPFRHYYQTRNILLSSFRGGVHPFRAMVEVGKRLVVIVVTGFVAGNLLKRLSYAVSGLIDGVFGRGGPMASKEN